MNLGFWLAPLVVLIVGLAVGLVAARRLRIGKARNGDPKADLRLEISDLEARRDELYLRLERAADEGLEPAQIAELETAAALSLRDRDRALAQLGDLDPGGKESTRPVAETPVPRRGSAIAGFATGVAATSLVSLLIFWAGRDAKPDPRRMGMEAQASTGGEQPPHEAAALPPMVAQQVATLEARLADAPDDIDTRKELALTLLAAEQYVPAFQHASEVLKRVPGDPDSLFVGGVVRVAMGQNPEAIEVLDQVLDRFPNHVYAHLYKGIALVRTGKPDAALAAWKTGLREAGGSHREIEHLIAMVENGAENGLTEAPPAAIETPDTSAAESTLAWQTPDDWSAETPSSPMRRAQYRVPGAAGDGELVVFYFGAGQGGDAMANARRWANQFRQADGRPSSEVMATSERKVGDMPVLLVEVEGIYTGGMSGANELPDAMLLGAVARGPDANWFFKLTGPRTTIEAQRPAFDALVGSLRPANAG